MFYKYIRARFEHALINAHQREPAEEVVVSEIKRLCAQGLGGEFRRGRRRHVLEYRVEQGREVGRLVGQLLFGYPLPADGVHHGEVALLVVGAELQKKFQHPLLGHRGVGGGFVYFVDDYNRAQAELERLFERKARQRHRALLRVYHQQDRVYRAQYALPLAPEVGMSRRVHDVYLGSLILNRRVFGVDGDATLELQSVGVHRDALHRHARLAQQSIGQGGLAVVHVRDNGDVSDIHRNEKGGRAPRDAYILRRKYLFSNCSAS